MCIREHVIVFNKLWHATGHVCNGEHVTVFNKIFSKYLPTHLKAILPVPWCSYIDRIIVKITHGVEEL